MLNEFEKQKNIKDLEYNHLLNKQNISLILIGTAIITTLFTENLPLGLSRDNLLLFLISVGIIFLWYFGKELNRVKEDIIKI